MHQGTKLKQGTMGGALVALLALAPVSDARAQGPAVEDPNIELRIDTKDLELGLGARLAASLEAELGAKLGAEGHTLVPRRGEVVLELRIAATDPDSRNYWISFALGFEGQWHSLVDSAPCEACSEQRLLEEAVALLPELDEPIAELEPAEAKLAPDPEPEPEPEPPTESRVRQHQPLSLGALGLTGAVLISAGALAAGGGGVLMSLPDANKAASRSELGDRVPNWAVSPFRVGAWMGIGGAVAAAVGVTALAIDLTSIRKCCRNWTIHAAPSADMTRVGLNIFGSF